MSKRVCFDDNILVYEEPSELSYFLHQSRISDWNQRQLNKIRMEHLLNPILTIQHRLNMFKKIANNVI